MYNAIIGKIKVKPHPNADRIKLATICNEQVIVSLDAYDDQLMVFFPCDGQLSERFCKANVLIGMTDPKTGKREGGYFDRNRRVRAQKFRGEVSDGFAVPLDYLFYAGVDMRIVDALKEGDKFCELGDVHICNKYITKATKTARAHKAQQLNRKNPRFPEHSDTKQFRHEVDHIPPESIVYFTEKLHGTSGRYAYVQDDTPTKANWLRKLFRFKPKKNLQWVKSVGTRRVILKDKGDIGYHGPNDFRYDFMQDVWPWMKKGEVIYGEIVGFDSIGKPIMPPVSTKTLKDKDFQKQYGESFIYKYGCLKGGHDFYVYRIAQVNKDGDIFDLPWLQVKQRCKKLGLKHVPEISAPIFACSILVKLCVSQLIKGESTLDHSHIREGVALRVEHAGGVYFLKEKSFEFKVLEGIIKDNPDYVDQEEQEDVE